VKTKRYKFNQDLAHRGKRRGLLSTGKNLHHGKGKVGGPKSVSNQQGRRVEKRLGKNGGSNSRGVEEKGRLRRKMVERGDGLVVHGAVLKEGGNRGGGGKRGGVIKQHFFWRGQRAGRVRDRGEEGRVALNWTVKKTEI